jgi:hypothetical protein
VRPPTGCEAELELGDDPEVAATAAQPPEQLGMLLGCDVEKLAFSGDQRIGDDVVAGQPAAPGQPPHTATEGQAADAGVGDVSGRRCQTHALGGACGG